MMNFLLKSGIAGVVAGVALIGIANVDVAHAQLFGGGETAEMRTQIERLQRDVRDLQAEVFRDGNTGGGAGAAISGQRVDDIEQSLVRLTGNVEQLTFQLNQLTQRLDRMQNQMDLLERNQAQSFSFGLPPEGEEGMQAYELPDGEPRELALAPSEGTLGTIPLGTPQPGAALENSGPDGFPVDPNADPQAEFDAAMGLLTRAQYDRAQDSFRSIAANYPDTEIGGQALYWSADIAYSVDRNYQGAARGFAELLRQYPDTPRAPEGMLKLGLALFALGQKQEGCVTLAALPRTYPNASATIANRARNERRDAECN
jgi:tol-pal system protein YbgF